MKSRSPTFTWRILDLSLMIQSLLPQLACQMFGRFSSPDTPMGLGNHATLHTTPFQPPRWSHRVDESTRTQRFPQACFTGFKHQRCRNALIPKSPQCPEGKSRKKKVVFSEICRNGGVIFSARRMEFGSFNLLKDTRLLFFSCQAASVAYSVPAKL